MFSPNSASDLTTSALEVLGLTLALFILSLDRIPRPLRITLPTITVIYFAPTFLVRSILLSAGYASSGAGNAHIALFDLVSAILVDIFAFGLLFRETGLVNGDDEPITSRFDAIYFSTITWTTVGFGDIKPKPNGKLSKLLSMLEVIFSWAMLAVAANRLAPIVAAIYER